QRVVGIPAGGDFGAVGEAVPVAVGQRGIRAVENQLVGVGQAIAVGVGGARVRAEPELVDVAEAVVVLVDAVVAGHGRRPLAGIECARAVGVAAREVDRPVAVVVEAVAAL